MEPILQLDSLSVQFDTSIQRINALDHVSLQINKGEIVGIIGASGSGKSTLAKTILGLLAKNQKTTGQIRWRNGIEKLDLLQQSKKEWEFFRKNRGTMVFQNPLLNLNPSATIRSHFERILSLRSNGYDNHLINNALDKVDLTNEVESILASYPHQLSGGQQQRILIALALCQEVQLLILDEPMSSLDKQNQDGISKILRRLVTDQEISIILISHDLNIIEQLSDRIYVLYQGKIVEKGTNEDILSNPKHLYTKALVHARTIENNVTIDDQPTSILSIHGLTHVYQKGGFLSLKKSSVTALRDVDISIPKSSIIGIVGPSGSGKSTLVKIMLGVEDLQKGSILWEDVDVSSIGKKGIRKRIQMIPQNTADALNPRILLDDQLREVYYAHFRKTEGYEKVISSLLSDVELNDQLRYRYPSELSGGEIQRMAIVRALIIRPEILVLDESLSALDMLVQKTMIDLLFKLNKQLGMTMIMISHDDRLIRGCCDKVFHLNHGSIVSM